MGLTKRAMQDAGMFEQADPETRLERAQRERLTELCAQHKERERVLAILRRYAQRAHITDSDKDAWGSAIADIQEKP